MSGDININNKGIAKIISKNLITLLITESFQFYFHLAS